MSNRGGADLKQKEYALHRGQNPGGCEFKESFAERLEYAFAHGQQFSDFLRQTIQETWNVSPDTFRQTVIRNLDARYNGKPHKDTPEQHPHAVQRYLAEGGKADAHDHRPAVPSDVIISNWMEKKSDPSGTQLTLLALSFGLSQRHEQMMWKILQGRPLTSQQLYQAIKKGDSAALGSLLVRASGYTEERLAELLDVHPATVQQWTDRTSRTNIRDIETAGRFAKILTQCLELEDSELKTWQLGMFQRDIASVMTGRDLEKRPASSKEAAVRFQQIFEDAFEKKQTFSQFLNRVMEEWGTNAAYFDFLNQNNAKEAGKDKNTKDQPAQPAQAYEPITTHTFFTWVNDEEKPRAGWIEKIAHGAFMTPTQELKLWKMTHGKAITAEQIQADIAAGNSGVVLSRLVEASGIGRNYLLEHVGIGTGDLQKWVNQEKPRPVHNIQKAAKLADILLPFVEYGAPPPEEQVAALREQVINCLTGRNLTQSLYEMALDAVGHEHPHRRMVELILEKTAMTIPELSEKTGIPKQTIINFKNHDNLCSETTALKLIEAAGGGDDLSVREAVSVLTNSRTPSELLNLAEQGKIWIGTVCEETRHKRWHMSRMEAHDKSGVSNTAFVRFEDADNPHPVGFDIADKIGTFLEFKGDEHRRFLMLATGKKLEPVMGIVADAEQLRCPEHEIFRRLCAQTGFPLEEISKRTHIPVAQLQEFSEGKTPVVMDEQSLQLFGQLCGLEEKSAGMNRFHDIFIPGPERIMHLMEAGRLDRVAGLERLMAMAQIPPETMAIRPQPTREAFMEELLTDPRLEALLQTIGDNLRLSPSSLAMLQMIYDPTRGMEEPGFVASLNLKRKSLIGDVMGGVLEHHAKWEKILTDSEPYLKIFDRFAAQSGNRDTQGSFKVVRALLAGEPLPHGTNGLTIQHDFRLLAGRIVEASSPEKGVSAAQWRGEVFDAVNKLLFQRLSKYRKQFDLESPATGAAEARHQKKLLLEDASSRNVLVAMMATNNGNLARIATSMRLHDLPQYASNTDSMLSDLWMGDESDNAEIGFTRGGLAVFLQWNPTKSRFSTFCELPIRQQVTHMLAKSKKLGPDGHGEYTNSFDGKDDEENSVGGIDQFSYRQYVHERSLGRDEPDEVLKKMGQVWEALKMLPRREQILLTAVFEGVIEGKHRTHQQLGTLISTPEEPLTRERVRQLLSRAYEQFVDAWKIVAGRETAVPVGIEQFMERSRKADDDGVAYR